MAFSMIVTCGGLSIAEGEVCWTVGAGVSSSATAGEDSFSGFTKSWFSVSSTLALLDLVLDLERPTVRDVRLGLAAGVGSASGSGSVGWRTGSGTDLGSVTGADSGAGGVGAGAKGDMLERSDGNAGSGSAAEGGRVRALHGLVRRGLTTGSGSGSINMTRMSRKSPDRQNLQTRFWVLGHGFHLCTRKRRFFSRFGSGFRHGLFLARRCRSRASYITN